MSESEMTNLFEPFYATPNKESRSLNPNGNGLGLFICKSICEHLGGSIKVTSVQGFGTKFEFTIEGQLGAHYSGETTSVMNSSIVVSMNSHIETSNQRFLNYDCLPEQPQPEFGK